MRKIICALLLSAIANMATSQITSTNGTFIAAGTANLGLLTNTTPRLTVIGSGTNIGRVWVGTGTPSPADLLHVNGIVRSTQLNLTGGILNTIGATNLSFRTNGTTQMTLSTSGYLGLGTPTPAYKLDVLGTINATSILIDGQPLPTSQWATTGSGINYSGNVGIGTKTPSSKLDIQADVGTSALRIQGGFPYGTYYFDITPFLPQNPWTVGYNLNLRSSNGAFNNFMTFLDGKVGIGTTTPSDKLEVDGHINVGLNSGAATGYGNRLNLRGVADDGDPMWLSRYNVGSNQTELRVNIGDDNMGEDAFVVGNHYHADGQWRTFLKVFNSGNVGIGTTAPGSYKLAVAGKIAAWDEIKVFTNGSSFPDYVFDTDYRLPSLEETETYIKENHHLPEVPSATEIAKDGMSLNGMSEILLKKVEELTLYMIELKKENAELKKELKEMKENLKK
jgi:hypothetical protein